MYTCVLSPCSFGNRAFATWHKLLVERAPALITALSPPPAAAAALKDKSGTSTAWQKVLGNAEVGSYVHGSFSWPQCLLFLSGCSFFSCAHLIHYSPRSDARTQVYTHSCVMRVQLSIDCSANSHFYMCVRRWSWRHICATVSATPPVLTTAPATKPASLRSCPLFFVTAIAWCSSLNCIADSCRSLLFLLSPSIYFLILVPSLYYSYCLAKCGIVSPSDACDLVTVVFHR